MPSTREPPDDESARHLPDLVLRFDRDGRLLFANEAVAHALGRGPAHLVGRLARELIPSPEDAARFADALAAVGATGEPATLEVRRDGDGATRWIEYRLLAERVADGVVETVLAIGRDVTRTRDAVRALRASEARYRALVEATSQVIWGAGPGGELGDAMDGWLAYTGQSADAAHLGGDEWLEVVHPDDRPAAHAAWTGALRSGSVYEARYRLHRRDGAWRTVVARAAPVRGDGGRIVEWIGTITDVTDRAALERTLHETEHRLATLIGNLPGIAYRVRDDARRTAEVVSDGVVALTGHPADAFLAGDVALGDLVLPEDRARVGAAVRAALDAGAPFEIVYCIARADGATRWVWEKGRAGSPGDDGARAVEGLIVDVTDREEARAALEAERARLLEAQRIARLGSWSWDLTTGESHVSAEWSPILGVDVEADADPVATLRRLLAPEERARFEARLAEIARDRLGTTEARWRIVRPDGEERVLHIRSVWEFDAAGKPVAGSGTFQDVTSQAAAEAQIERQRNLLEESQRLAHVGSWELDLATDAVTSSDEMLAIAGLSPDVGPLTPALIGEMMGEERDYVLARLAEGIATGQPVEYEHHIHRPDGSVRLVLARGRMVRGDDGAVVRVVGASQDITERRQLELQLRRTQKLEALGMLAGSVAHDFNNLLSTILGGAELARLDVEDGTRVAADLEDIRQAARRAAELTRQLLTFSRTQVRRPRVVDLRDAARQAERLLRRLLPDDVTLDVVIGPEAQVVLADAGQLEQVMMNLVVNARDAVTAAAPLAAPPAAPDEHPGGVVTLAVETRTISDGVPYTTARDGSALPAGRYAALVVRDTGVGMDAATLQRIFEPFFTTKAEGRGTGLGLATVFGIVAQHDGAVHVESAPGKGATFTVLLPTVEGPVDTAEVGATPPPGGAETILLVEDEAIVRATATRILERSGYRVIAARHGGDAMLAWREHGPSIDAVVTDMRMPAMDGRALAEALRAERPELPLVVMSGYPGGAPEGVDLPDHEVFLEKPFTAESLLRHVRAAIDRSRGDRPREDRTRGDGGGRPA